MTLIACTVTKNIPFIVSDLLFSNKVGKENMQVPTNNFALAQFYPDDLNDLTYKPVQLEQKVYILKKNLCLLLGGVRDEMQDLLTAFRKYTDDIKEPLILYEQVIDFLKTYNFVNNFKESSFGLLHMNTKVKPCGTL